MEELKTVILAAGKGTRMKSELPKVVHKVMGKPMVEHVIDAARQAGSSKICLVVGYQADVVKSQVISKAEYVLQEEQLGTGHAVKCAKDFIGETGETLILCGDTPLITGRTLKKLVKSHRENKNAVTVLSAYIDNPTGYGRIIRDRYGRFIKSVEHKDATENEKLSKEINSGMYIFNAKALSGALDELNTNNAQGEYYLPDTLTILKSKGLRVDAMAVSSADEIAGVNTIEQLKEAEVIMKKRELR